MLDRKIVLRGIGLLTAIVILLVSAYFWFYKSEETNVEQGTSNNSVTTYKDAMKAKKPFVVLFYSQWCRSCAYFAPRFEMLSEIYKDKYNFVTINADLPENIKTDKEFSLSGVPSMYIVDPAIDNRIFINNAMYFDLGKVRTELDRYLRIREMIKK